MIFAGLCPQHFDCVYVNFAGSRPQHRNWVRVRVWVHSIVTVNANLVNFAGPCRDTAATAFSCGLCGQVLSVYARKLAAALTVVTGQ